MALTTEDAGTALCHVRRAGQIHWAGQARDARFGPRTAVVPAGARQGAKDPALADRIAQVYESKQYAGGGRYIVLGAGIASVHECANILDAGGSVLALTRSPQPETQDLSVPRWLFESIGIDAYARGCRSTSGLSSSARSSAARGLSSGNASRGSRTARRKGGLMRVVGEIDKIEPGRAGLRVYVKSMHGEAPGGSTSRVSPRAPASTGPY